jgi:hypothetical protein
MDYRPSEFLGCGHALCSTCCEELCDGEIVQCPFCNKTGNWHYTEVPDGAGPRVLTIKDDDAEDRRHDLLANIEAQLNIPIHQLFDLIVGTGMGTILALTCGVLKRPANEVVEKWRDDFREYVYFCYFLFLLLSGLK